MACCRALLLLAIGAIADKACKNMPDDKIYDIIKGNISNIQKDCILNGAPGANYTEHCLRKFGEGVPDGEACMSDCVHQKTNLSTTCSACFGSISGCVYKNCVMHCLDAKAPACISCTKQYCLADFVTCTGFDDLPPAGLQSTSQNYEQIMVVNVNNACQNDADDKIYSVIKSNISSIQKECILNGAPGANYTQHCLRKFGEGGSEGQACMCDCVHKRTNLSTSCSSCFGSISGCVYKNCVMHCLDAKAPACLSCTKQYCLKDFVDCTGFRDLPPAEGTLSIKDTDKSMVPYVANACKNDADDKIYSVIKSNISNIQKDCIVNGAPGVNYTQHCLRKFTESEPAGEACMSDCVHKRTDLSTTCSTCFGSISGCVFKNCVMHCLDAKAPACISCTKQYCLKDFVTCTGFQDLPPAAAGPSTQTLHQVLV